jgi:drug/metabolite transporter (DMT)-like permease
MMRTAITLIILVLSSTGGDLCVAQAMKRIGEVKDFTPKGLLRVLGRVLREGWMWIGIGQMTLAFCSLLALLSWEAVSFVIPATALSYVTGALGSKYLLGEQLTRRRWVGIGLVSVGVLLVCLGQ